MQSKTKWILGAAGFAAFIAISALLYQTLGKQYAPSLGFNGAPASSAVTSNPQQSAVQSQSSQPQEQERVLVPDISVLDMDGNTVNLSDFAGKPVIMNFWASWCPPCKAEMPDFETLYGEYGDEVVFMMINATDGARETQQLAKDYIAEQGYTFPVYFDLDTVAVKSYGISAFPTTLLVDKDGYLAGIAESMLDEATLRKGLALILPE